MSAAVASLGDGGEGRRPGGDDNQDRNTFGGRQTARFRECKCEDAFEMLDYFYSQGGNFIDNGLRLSGGRVRGPGGRVDEVA
ncbi:uncharacterized protein THITE_2092073 [Thermothielavioides terrestris NRRL 8126]|uniref:Uncharacterized protein n=1 Tax=Thermothielavioides terrestris (strain ATCC 38088 / NRRL 8126) TaxID=578455 RepID=G2RCD3_THETT|nr:uncharacterized protein THITE_2092073 [Thermothielavioides terrestris NRRL 8126]AEO70568.1 hypothetical protein THITE_2092073 [Thermothielavioides terrestris NRRL 8126]